MKPRLAVTHGDPAGIGPELIAKLLAEPDASALADVVLVGDRHVFQLGQDQAGIHWPIREVDPNDLADLGSEKGVPLVPTEAIAANELRLAQVSEASGRASLRNLDKAMDLTLAGFTDAILFAPLNKTAMHLAGLDLEDEHRYIARYIGFTGHNSEINMLDELITTRVTSHVAMKDAVVSIDQDGVVRSIRLAHETLVATGKSRPRIGVAALNPHAGDNGKFGTEEIEILAPAIKRAQAMQMDVSGPWPSDTVFLRGRDGQLDAVVTMYHDQGQIAMKLMGFDRGVTISAGLPIPVVTPAHGTAFDIVGKGIANSGAIRKAFDVLCRMAANRRR